MSDAGFVRTGLQKLRADRWARWGSTVGGWLIGLAVAWIHPVGIVLGAALVAAPRRSVARGLAIGVLFGLSTALVTFGLLAAVYGQSGLAAAVALRQVSGVTLAIGTAGGFVGGLFRGVA